MMLRKKKEEKNEKLVITNLMWTHVEIRRMKNNNYENSVWNKCMQLINDRLIVHIL